MIRRRDVLAGIAALGLAGPGMTAPGRRIEIFGHRGASALRPEHTLASYAKAIADGADFIEPDLVISRDGVLIVRHENNIAETTDVARHPDYAGRRTEKVIDGQRQVGWFVEDFTLAELKTLRAIERLPRLRPQNAAMDGQYDLVTWPEMIDFAAAEASARGRPVGLVPELKHSTYFRGIGMPLEDRFLETLRHDYTQRCPLVIQSFEIANLRYLRDRLGRRADLRLMQLAQGTDPTARPADIAARGGRLTYAAMMTPAGLADIARYADIIAPDTRSVIPLGADRKLGAVAAIAQDAKSAGLQLVPWTFRPENFFLAADFQNDTGAAARNPQGSVDEIRAYLAAGIDGFFTDDPALGRAALDALSQLGEVPRRLQ